jgi:hydrogenase expression/formation protein HypD
VKYIDEFRDGALARRIAVQIAAEVRADRRYHFMEFCGGHTHAISRYGVADLLPPNVKMIHGPGCPVCGFRSPPGCGCRHRGRRGCGCPRRGRWGCGLRR